MEGNIKVLGFGNYEVTFCSKVFNMKTGKELKGWLNKEKYRRFEFRNNGESIQMYLHRLAAIVWELPNPENKLEINHLDRIRDHNKWPNLEWSTHKENIDYKYQKNHSLPPRTATSSVKSHGHLEDNLEDLPF